jgi:hypothetical protein
LYHGSGVAYLSGSAVFCGTSEAEFKLDRM